MRSLLRALLRRVPPSGYLYTSLAVLFCMVYTGAPARAQSTQVSEETPVADDVLILKADVLLREEISAEQRSSGALFLLGERLSGQVERDAVIEGQAQLRRAGTVVHADRLEYDQTTDQARALGNVRINHAGNVYTGSRLDLKLSAFQGSFQEPVYKFLQNDAHGQASRVDFLDANRSIVYDASYTTCTRQPGPGWLPDWVLRATRISFDNAEDIGAAQGAVLSFKGVPLLPIPEISFPLSNRRKSGVLPPTLGVDSVNGSELMLPYYWNIAPNRDATFTPTLMVARGVNYGGEFRYLEPSYSGEVQLSYMPVDKLRDTDRWGLILAHRGNLNLGLSVISNVALSVNVNRVSDDNYWRDFTRAKGALRQRLLPSNLDATWGHGGYFGGVKFLKWQTLQDSEAPIVPPYDRVPQLYTGYTRTNVRGFDLSVEADLTQFEADRLKTLQPNAQRGYALLQASRPWLFPGGVITPKLQLHTSAYQFDAPLSNDTRSSTSTVPTLSVDSSLAFEREVSLWGSDFVQTLEPRAFYVYTPYRYQGLLPNYDTAANDFNFSSIYAENSFVGHDKIADSNLLTFGLTTRLLHADTAKQVARFSVAQRLRLENQRVTLTPSAAPAEAGFSDILWGATVNVSDRWALDSTFQYNAKTQESERSVVGARYSPSSYRVLNTAYRFQRAQLVGAKDSRLVDVSWQWPINDLWGDRGQDLGAGRGQGVGRYYSVGRMNYSFTEKRLVDTIIGIEYDAGCWLSRVVAQRTQTGTFTATQSLMFQLEFVGFTRVGISPQRTLINNISRYQNLREIGTSYSRFSNYD